MEKRQEVNSMRLNGKVAVVTGSARGIGRAITLAFAREGANLVINDVHAEKANDVVKEIESLGGKAVAVVADVSVREEAEKIIDAAIDRFGRIDILVNNAGITRDALFLKMTEEDWDKVMAVNLKGVFHCTKAALKHMVERKYGKIITISSMAGVSGNVGQTNYGASKAGVIGFTLCLAREMAKHGININSICPGFIDTELTRAIPEKVKSTMIPFLQYRAINHRLGKPEDVATVAVFLASDESSYITGEVIKVTGGAF